MGMICVIFALKLEKKLGGVRGNVYLCELKFVKRLKKKIMNTMKLTREEALKRVQASIDKKKAFVAELERSMREEYRKETGKEAKYFSVL